MEEEQSTLSSNPVATTTTTATSGGGTGRGRGRGGVPLLPTGVWSALNGLNDLPTESSLEKLLSTKRTTTAADNDDQQEEEEDKEEYRDAPSHHHQPQHQQQQQQQSFKGKGGRGGKGLEVDAKGKDWNCPSCTNLNWSWRTNCNICGTPKPSHLMINNENIARDGAAGGFNERQDRASSNTVEIDEEGFDDFGRRVKKVATVIKSDKQAKEEAALKRLQDKYRHLLPTGGNDNNEGMEEIRLNTNDPLRSLVSETKKSISKDDDREQQSTRSYGGESNHHHHYNRNHGNDRDRRRERSRSRDRDRRGDTIGRDRSRDREDQNKRRDYDRDHSRDYRERNSYRDNNRERDRRRQY